MIAIGKSAELFTPGSHGSTFGGNPISCAAANVVLEEIERSNLLRKNAEKGALLRKKLAIIPGVVEARGKGLLLGIEVEEHLAKTIARELQQAGYLVNGANEDVIRIAPSYLVTEGQLIKFVKAFERICRKYYG